MLEAQKQQGQRVLAGKFAAGAGAFEGRAGQVDLHLIGLGPAALAFTPQRGVVTAECGPFARRDEAVRRLDGGYVRGQSQHGVESHVHRSS